MFFTTILTILLLSIHGNADCRIIGASHQISFPSFDGAISVYAADMEGDGDMDVLVAAHNADDITWLENTDGSGTNWTVHQVGYKFYGAYSVYAADMDGDGDMDVLGVADLAGDVTWWENTDGSGTSWTEHLVDGAFDGARSVYAADMDGDGDMDVLGAAYNADDVTWWENTDGSGTSWTEHLVDGAFDGARSVYAADMDGDGDMDVLGAAVDDDDIAWWENTDGTGTSWTEHLVDGAFDGARSVYAADMDGDGDMDVLGVAGNANNVTWWENTDGSGTSWTEHLVDGAFDGAISVHAADLDGDGDMDVLGAAIRDGDITWWENTDGSGTSWTEHLVDGAFDGAISVHAADLDGDGDMDVLGAAYHADDITWWENKDGTGTIWTEHLVGGDFDGVRSVYAADMDGDGDMDVLGAARDPDAGVYDINWWENTDGSGTSWTEHLVGGDFDVLSMYVYPADMDGDGDMDFLEAITFIDGNDINWWENTDGSGTSWTVHQVDHNLSVNVIGNSVYAADMDGDGDMDVFGRSCGWSPDYGDKINWWENTDGSGTSWTEHLVGGLSDGVHSVYAADMDGDGDMDVLGSISFDYGGGDYINWWENTDGSGTSWTEHLVDGDFRKAWSVYAADMDGDGDMDVLGAGFYTDAITWWENTDGSGTSWTEHLVDGAFDGARSVYAADMDGDGDMDVLGAANIDDDITWWENTDGSGTSWTEHLVDGDFDGAYSVYAADMDGDGDLDVLSGTTWWGDHTVLTGIVCDFSTGLFLSNATVSATLNNTTTTNNSGSYTLYLSPVDYDVTFSKTGYQTITIADVTIVEQEINELNVDLIPTGLLNITTTSFPCAVVGVHYEEPVRITGGIAPYNYSISYGSLPPDLTIDTVTGAITGTPNTPGTFTFAVGVTDAAFAYAERELEITVTQPLTITTSSPLPMATLSESYSLSLTATGGIEPYNFSVISGDLPSGLILSSSGLLSGTPSAAGSFYFTVRVTDGSCALADEKSFHLEVKDPLKIDTSTMNDGIVGTAYSQALTASGGSGDYTWQVHAGQLPPGLTIDGINGTITGTPSLANYYTFVVSVSDEEEGVAYKDLTTKVVEPLDILTTSLPNALIDEQYSESIRTSGGLGPYTFSSTGLLPTGLSLNTSTGVIYGTPSVAGYTNVEILVTDSTSPGPQSDSQILNIRVTPDLTITTSAEIPNDRMNVTISPIILSAGGGSSPYMWQLVYGYLPEGITLNTTTGVLSGTPMDKGNFTFTIQVTDADNTTAEKAFYWHISGDLSITTSAVADGAKDTPYSFMLDAEGGIKPYTWSLVNGTLPSGLSLNPTTGTIYGTPTVLQTNSFTIEVSDGDSPALTDQRTYNMQTLDELYVYTRTIPNGRVDEAYTATISAALGTPPYSWRLESGVLPPGLTLTSSPTIATLEGTPAVVGTYTFALEVSDTGTPVDQAVKQYTIEIYDDVQIVTDSLPTAVREVPYSESIVVAGGKFPYRWQIVDGHLPLGLILNSTTGYISGVTNPDIGMSETFTVRVSDSGNPNGFDEKELFITVTDPSPLTIDTTNLPDGTQKSEYLVNLEASGGVPPYTWIIDSGKLPTGITIDDNTGQLSGYPFSCGSFDFTVGLTDSASMPNSTTSAFSLNVVCCNDYDISGNIPGGDGVVMNLTGDATDSTTVDGFGHYTFQHLTNGNYVITPNRDYYSFTPTSQNIIVNNLDVFNVNFTMSETDTDNDGIPDVIEAGTCTDPDDADSDEDGIPDGTEDADHNGNVDSGETDPCLTDTDGDGIQDGTEIGLTLEDIGPDTNTDVFIPDVEPSTTTDPLDNDSDHDGIPDGEEDANHNGREDEKEALYVDGDVAISGDGTSWEQAVKTVQEVIDATGAIEIWVKEGTYDLTTTILVNKLVKIYGGFNGTELQRNQRNIVENTTVLNGQNSVRCLYVTADAIIDGFTITNGTSDIGGAGMFNESCSPKISNCAFSSNYVTSWGGGGGVYNANCPSANIDNCIFSHNEACFGSGIYNGISYAIITNCIFNDNTGQNGGGIFNHESSPVITNCTFFGNSVTKAGGIYNYLLSSPIITNSILWGNTATTGPEIFNEADSYPVFTYCDVDQDGYSGTNGNIRSNPLFVDATNGDFHLQEDSPCVNKGSNIAPEIPIYDFEGEPRIQGRRCDIGADEFPQRAIRALPFIPLLLLDE